MRATWFSRPFAIAMFIPMIGLGVRGAWFATYCLSDGCLGIYLYWAAALAAFAVQALLVLPLHAWALKKDDTDAAGRYTHWLGCSVIAVLLPMIAGWVYMPFK